MIEKTPEKNEKNVLSAENAAETDFSSTEEIPKKNIENEEKNAYDNFLEEQGFDSTLAASEQEDDQWAEGEQNGDLDIDDFDDLDLDDDWDEDDLDLDIEEGADPLSDIKDETPNEPAKTTIGDLQEPVSNSPKNLENIEKLAHIVLNGADVLKAQFCSKISGEHVAEYLADDNLKATLIEAIKEYLATQEIKAPTPFGTLMLTLAMWTLPPLGMAVWDKYQVNKTTKKNKTSTTSTEQPIEQEPGEAKTDYSHLKEYQEQRKIFSLNKTKGTYNRTPKGTFIKVEHANEEPSPIIKEWIDAGLTNKEIRERLAYE